MMFVYHYVIIPFHPQYLPRHAPQGGGSQRGGSRVPKHTSFLYYKCQKYIKIFLASVSVMAFGVYKGHLAASSVYKATFTDVLHPSSSRVHQIFSPSIEIPRGEPLRSAESKKELAIFCQAYHFQKNSVAFCVYVSSCRSFF